MASLKIRWAKGFSQQPSYFRAVVQWLKRRMRGELGALRREPEALDDPLTGVRVPLTHNRPNRSGAIAVALEDDPETNLR